MDEEVEFLREKRYFISYFNGPKQIQKVGLVMKNLIRKIRVRIVKATFSISGILVNNSGQGMIDTAVQILISVILGALVLAGLYTLFGSTILPELSNKISGMFNYAG